MMLGVVDALLLGRLSVEALDAVALANMWGWCDARARHAAS